MGEELRGMPVVKAMAAALAEQINLLEKADVTPTLAVVRVGSRTDDLAYERGLIKRFENNRAKAVVCALPDDCTQKQLEDTVLGLNADPKVHGILVFRPLPRHLNEQPLKTLIDPHKDVDCLGLDHSARLFLGDKSGFAPCTPMAVMKLLAFYGIDPAGKNVVVIGRSAVVGKPLAMLLLGANATVTICHTKTKNLAEICRGAQLVVACAGVAKMVDERFVAPGATVIDVGINPDGDSICGDVDFDRVLPVAGQITPVPGGVGTVTTSVLLEHTVQSALQTLNG